MKGYGSFHFAFAASVICCLAASAVSQTTQWAEAGYNGQHAGMITLSSYPISSIMEGTQKWSASLPAMPATGVCIDLLGWPNLGPHDYRSYVGVTDNKIYCFQVTYDYLTNTFSAGSTPVWTHQLSGQPIGTPARGSNSSPGEVLFVSDASGTVTCLNAATGATVWAWQSGSSVTGPVIGTAVYVGTANGRLYSLARDVQAPQTNWYGFTAGAVANTPTVEGVAAQPSGNDYGHVFVTTTNGYLQKFVDPGTSPNPVPPTWSYRDLSFTSCDTWATIWFQGNTSSPPARVYYGIYDAGSGNGAIWALLCDPNPPDQPYPLWTTPLTQAPGGVPPHIYNVRHPAINPINNGQDSPNIYFLGRYHDNDMLPAVLKVVDTYIDNGPQTQPTGIFEVPMPSSDVLNSSPVYASVPSTWSYLFYVTEAGTIYAVDPASGASPLLWPHSTGKHAIAQDMAMDVDGAVVFSGWYRSPRGGATTYWVYAYWGVAK